METNHNDEVTNQFKSIFEKINIIFSHLQNLEKQNELLIEKIDNIEKHVNITIPHNFSAISEKMKANNNKIQRKKILIKMTYQKNSKKENFQKKKLFKLVMM